MKRDIIAFLALVLVFSCTSCYIRKTDDKSVKQDIDTQSDMITEPNNLSGTESDGLAVTTVREDSNFITSIYQAGIYNMTSYNAGTKEEYELINDFKDDKSSGRDICVLAGFPSREVTLSGKNMRDIWTSCIDSNNYPETIRIGYFLEFLTPEGKCENLILRPSNITDEYWEYIEIYIYDDIHQEAGAWYSHLVDDEFTDESIISSVKITAGNKVSDISDLQLTAFLYEIGDRERITADYAKINGFTVNIYCDNSR